MQPVKIFQLTLLCILGSIAMIANSYAQSITPMAKVNGVVIPNSRLELLMKGLISQGQADTPETRKAVREDLIKQELLAQEALKKDLIRPQILPCNLSLVVNQYWLKHFKMIS